MHIALISLMLLLSEPAVPGDLTGSITNADGAPLPLATVLVYSGAPKKGTAKQVATEVPDTAKSVTTNAQGAFTIRGVDPSMNFELLVLAEGFRPIMLKKVDPARGEIQAKLQTIPKDVEADHLVRGHVVDADGKPVVGARVEVFGARIANQRWYGSTPDTERETYTDAKGTFTLICKKPDLQLDVKIVGRNVAPLICTQLPEGEQVNEITMTPGASVTGRLTRDGQPMPGIRLKLMPTDQNYESNVGESTTITGENGKFIFSHVHPDTTYNLFAPMKTTVEFGALAFKSCGVSGDGTTIDAGELALEKALGVSGQIACSDEKRVPSSAKIQLWHSDTGDTLDGKVNTDGKFEFKNVPSGVYYVSVQAGGYRLSHDNQSYYDPQYLCGVIDENIADVRIQIEPGSRDGNESMTMERINSLRGAKLGGVAAP